MVNLSRNNIEYQYMVTMLNKKFTMLKQGHQRWRHVMDFNNAIKISASALSANRLYMNVLSANLANVNTTRTADGKPYQRRTVLYESVPWLPRKTFDASSLDGFHARGHSKGASGWPMWCRMVGISKKFTIHRIPMPTRTGGRADAQHQPH